MQFIGPEFLASSEAERQQTSSTVTALSDGRFLVTWLEENSNSLADVKAKIFTADGKQSVDEFEITVTESFGEGGVSIASLPNGRFVAAWHAARVLDKPEVRSQIYNSDGTVFGNNFQVGFSGDGSQSQPSVTAYGDGGFIITWREIDSADGNFDSRIKAQIFGADGKMVGSEIQVSQRTQDFADGPTTAELPDGRFVVAWTKPQFESYAVFAQVFLRDGQKSGELVRIDGTPGTWKANPKLASLPDGKFAIVWGESGLGDEVASGFYVRAQMFNADGRKVGDPLQISDPNNTADLDASISSVNRGRFLISWGEYDNKRPENGHDVHAQLISADGNKLGSDFIVNSTVVNNQFFSSVDTLSDGTALIMWAESDQGFPYRIRGQLVKVESELPEVNVVGALPASEGDGQQGDEANYLEFFISLDQKPTEPIKVAYTTIDNTAKAGEDYVATDGEVEFGPDDTLQSVFVEIIGDIEREEDHRVGLVITGATTASGEPIAIGTDTEFGVIRDDDISIAITPLDLSGGPSFIDFLEGGGKKFVKIEISKAVDYEVIIDHELSHPELEEDVDFEQLVLKAGRTSDIVPLGVAISDTYRPDHPDRSYIENSYEQSSLQFSAVGGGKAVHISEGAEINFRIEDEWHNKSNEEMLLSANAWKGFVNELSKSSEYVSTFFIFLNGFKEHPLTKPISLFLDVATIGVDLQAATTTFGISSASAMEKFLSTEVSDVNARIGAQKILSRELYQAYEDYYTEVTDTTVKFLFNAGKVAAAAGILTALAASSLAAIPALAIGATVIGSAAYLDYDSTIQDFIQDATGRIFREAVPYSKFEDDFVDHPDLQLPLSTTPESIDLPVGPQVINSTLEEFDGLRIDNFGVDDTLVISGVNFDQRALKVTFGSAILDIDIDLDGETDSTIILEGDYEGAEFEVEIVGENTEITLADEEIAPIEGTNGPDRLYGTDGQDVIFGRAGDDQLFGYAEDDNLKGNGGDDTLFGHDGRDVLRGGFGADILFGGTGEDNLDGGRQADTLNGGRGSDTLDGGTGADVLNGGRGTDELRGGRGADSLFGNKGADVLNGGRGADNLRGGSGSDLLIGGRGSDTLVAGKGSDTLFGDSGADEFFFRKGFGNNEIEDFDLSRDIISIGAGAQKFSALEIEDSASGAQVSFKDVTVLVKGVEALDLTADHFVF